MTARQKAPRVPKAKAARESTTAAATAAPSTAARITSWDRLRCPFCDRPGMRINGTRTMGAVTRRYHHCPICGRHAHSEEMADGTVRWVRADRGREMVFATAG